jgi:hypothetical protein
MKDTYGVVFLLSSFGFKKELALGRILIDTSELNSVLSNVLESTHLIAPELDVSLKVLITPLHLLFGQS